MAITVNWPQRPQLARLVRRLNRFVVEIESAGQSQLIHLPNSGRLRELLVPGAEVGWLPRPERQGVTVGDLLLVSYQGRWVCVDARVPNQLAAALLQQRLWPRPLPAFTHLKREVGLADHRFDLGWQGDGNRGWLEVKSVTLVIAGQGRFPDAPTERGTAHLQHLQALRQQGDWAGVLFVIQRADATSFAPNQETDPAFAAALAAAARAGVEVAAALCPADEQGIYFQCWLPVMLP